MKVTENPFPGLRPFETEEYRLFFGREGQADALIERLGRSRFLAVVGTSGSGKSSLVRAGLLPALHGGMMAGAGAGWRVAVMRPGHDPTGNLACALTAEGVLAEAGGGLPPAEAEAVIEATLRRGSLGLVDAARAARLSEHEQLLVVVDQFEELFRFRAARAAASTGDDAAAFVKLLLEAARQRERPIYVVITMRSDFLGDCAQFPGLPEAINDGQYLIPRMTRDERRVAVVGPVRVARARMSEPLVNRLLNDVGDNPDQLPILQHALMRTWDYWAAHRRDSEPLGLSDYEAVGTMSDALSQHADEAWGELPDERSRKVAEILFKALTERGADNREIRRPTRLREICEIAGASEAEVAQVVEVFRREGRSFLMPPAGTPLGPDTVIDISHESLIRNWERLREWVRDEAEAARIYRRLADAAAAYGAGESGLLDAVTLGWVNRWRERYNPNRAWGVRYHPGYDAAMAFLEESRVAHEAQAFAAEQERAEQAERERRELEQAQAFAAEQERAARSLRRTARLLGVVSLIALVAVGAALVMAWRAETARQKLQKSRTALQLIQSYRMTQAKDELETFYRLTANNKEGQENRAWALYNLGDLNRKLESHDEAAAFFESALQAETMIHGQLGLDSIGTLDSLAHTHEEAGYYDSAITRLEQLSDILESATDQKDRYFRLNTANVYSDLATLYLKRGEDTQKKGLKAKPAQGEDGGAPDLTLPQAREKARGLYRKALAVWEETLNGDGHDPEALAEKYQQAADFFLNISVPREPEDERAARDLMDKSQKLRHDTSITLTLKSIGPTNQGNDPDINMQLPAEGPGYIVFNRDVSRTYGRPATVEFVKTLAAAWVTHYPGLELVVGDISRQGGGSFQPHVANHQDGREVDIWPMTNNDTHEPTNVFAPNYSRDKTRELVRLIQQTNPNAVVYFDDPQFVAQGLTHGGLDHYNYMHILLP
jgi:tetratricopeptide (TPR) repeat protein